MKQEIIRPCSKEKALGDNIVWNYNPITQKYRCSICGEEEYEFEDNNLVPMPINKEGEARFRRHQAQFQFERLKVGYHQERDVYTEFADKKLDEEDVQFITNKIARHFKIKQLYIKLHGNRDSGRAYRFGSRIRVAYNPSWHVVAHEINHFLIWKKSPNKRVRHGTKKWNRSLQRILKYIKKKNFWEQELLDRKQSRIEASKSKPEPTVTEIRSKKIEKAEAKMKRYESKIKMYQKKLQKARRSINALKRHQQKQISNFLGELPPFFFF